MNSLLIKHPTIFALVSAVMATTVLVASFMLMEPRVALSQSTPDDTFTVTATITGEISLEADLASVSLLPSIPGVTGGVASGTNSFTVTTNNALGYTVDIRFTQSVAMQRNEGAGSIPNLGGTVTPEFDFGAYASNSAAFAFSASGTDVITALRGTTASCGSGTAILGACFVLPDNTEVTPYEFVNSNDPTPSEGDRYDLEFRVVVEPDPSPSLTTGTYTATATLTAVEKS